MKTLILIACLISTSANALPHCVKGKSCGNSCIAMEKTCKAEQYDFSTPENAK
jgi:hypothetical protein